MIKANTLTNEHKKSIKLRAMSTISMCVYGTILMVVFAFTDVHNSGWISFIHNGHTRKIVACTMQLVAVVGISWILIFMAKELLSCFVGSIKKTHHALLSIGLILTQMLPTILWIIVPWIEPNINVQTTALYLATISIALPFFIYLVFLPIYLHIVKNKNGSKNTKFNRISFTLLSLGIPIAFCFIYYFAIIRTWTTIFLLLAIVVSCDIFAFIFGILFGKHKIAPNISPKKSWEGAIIGVVFSTIFCLFLFYISHFISTTTDRTVAFNFFGCQWAGGKSWVQSGGSPMDWSWKWWVSILFVLLTLACIGVLGDLLFSLFKRKNGIKDFSNFFPGHGGFLDRTDSFILVMITYGVFTFIVAVVSFYVHSPWGKNDMPEYIQFLFPNWVSTIV